MTERDDLSGKIKRAKKAIENPPYGASKHSISLLAQQVRAMDEYLEVLNMRILYEGGEK